MRFPAILMAFFLLVTLATHGQQATVDSLQQLLKTDLDYDQKSETLAKIGMAYYYPQIYMDSAYYYSEQSYLLAKSNELTVREARALFQMGLVQNFIGNFHEGIEFYHETIRLMEPLDMPDQLGSTYNNIGGSFFELGDYQMAINNYQKALNIAVVEEDTVSIAVDYMNLGEAYYKLNRLPDAKEKLEKSLALLEKVQYDPPTGHLFYARTMYAMGAIEIAEEEAHKSLAIAKNDGRSLLYISEASKLLATIYAHKNDFEKAYQYHEQFTVYNDSLNDARELNEIEKLKLNFELKEEQEAVASLSQKNRYVNIIYGLAGAGLLLLVILVFRQRKIVRMTQEVHDIQRRLVGQELEEREWKAKNPNATAFDAALSKAVEGNETH